MRTPHPYRHCDHCAQPKPPEGGCQVQRVRWLCFGCWRKFAKARRL